MAKRKGLAKQKKKSNHLFEILDDIRWHKTGKLLDSEEFEKKFTPYLVLRMLSMERENLEVVNLINQYQGDPNVTKKMIYKMLVDLIPKNKGYIKYIKHEQNKSKYTRVIMDYFSCSKREAEYYLETKGENWAHNIQELRGGKR